MHVQLDAFQQAGIQLRWITFVGNNHSILLMRLLPLLSSIIFVLSFILFACDSRQRPTSQSETAKKEIDPVYEQRGRGIARAAFVSLSSELQTALQKGGVAEALQYCNVNAIPLTDSLSTQQQVEIRRTSSKVRNSDNAATDGEAEVLAKYEKQFAAGEDLISMVVPVGKDHYKYYAPIMVSNNCLKCHGAVGKDIAEADYSIIQELYPSDQAINYQLGDFRGIWSIKMESAEAASK